MYVLLVYFFLNTRLNAEFLQQAITSNAESQFVFMSHDKTKWLPQYGVKN